MTYVTLNMVSGNGKVGAIPVSTTDEDSCPNQCPMKGTDCYARFGPLGMHWKKIGKDGRGIAWSLFCNAIKKLPKFQAWRHNQAGDLPKDENHTGEIDHINRDMALELSESSKHTRGWTYTHYDPTDSHNASIIKEINDNGGMTINLSADSMEEADNYYNLGIAPVTVVLSKNSPIKGNKTPNGLPIVICPAQTNDDIDCKRCMLCQKRDRKSIVGFLAHGTASKRLSERIESENKI